MGQIIVLSLISSLVILLIFGLMKKSSQLWILGISFLIAELVMKSFITYFMLSSRNPLSLIASNFWWALWMILFLSFVNDELGVEAYDHKPTPVLYGSILLVILGVLGLGGELHSYLSIKPVADSISSNISKDTEAPTFKRGVTPVALTIGTVKNRMNKSMSDVPNPQYYTLGDVEAQYYKGKPVYIAALEYESFWAYRKSHVIPGYFIIDATDVNASPKFVKKDMYYSPSSYFSHNAQRVNYEHYPDWLIADGSVPQLEISDSGHPYFVQTMYRPMSLSHRIDYRYLRASVLDAVSGQTKMYRLADLPKWVDEGVTDDVAFSMNKAYGSYQGGLINLWFSKTGVKVPTQKNVTTVFDNKGQINYFTDFTRDGSADSALGYSMVNARTGRLTYFTTNGITDSEGATKNADQNYRAQKWHASMPVIYNINGRSVWVMSILDDTNAFRGYYYLDAANQSINASGNNANEAVDNFRQSLSSNNVSAGNTASATTKHVKGTVDRVAVLSQSSNNVVILTVKNSKVMYTINLSDFQQAALTKPGDKVSMTSKVVNGKSIGNVSQFANDTLN